MIVDSVLKVARIKCLKGLLFFTRYFFKKRFNRKFVIGEHHELICEALERVYRGEITRLIINIAPRYGKTEVAVKNFIANGLALNPAAKFIHLSYSDTLALDNSEEVKDMVQESWYQELFPEVQIKKDSKAKKKWYTTKGGGVYATSSNGQVTGFGAGKVDEEEENQEEDPAEMDEFFADWEHKAGFGGAIIIDDPLKPEDALSDLRREKVNSRYDSTISNRVNSRKTPIIIIMQRLHPQDLCGYVIENSEPGEWEVLSLPSIKADGTALWPFKHTLEELNKLWKRNARVFESQHLQNPKPLEGLLYKALREYGVIPPGNSSIRAICDTADTGNDYLCCIVYVVTTTAYYISDVYYTQEGMETTENEMAVFLTKHNVESIRIESNNGGRGFARNVERICRTIGNKRTSFDWFHQSDNKQVRIFTKAAEVQNMIFFPAGWDKLWPAFYSAVTGYLAKGKNKHDDAPDGLTMIIEAEDGFKKSNLKGKMGFFR
jgi:predicted phage terminase large subunit-like protein